MTELAPMTFNMPRDWHFRFKMEATRRHITMHELLFDCFEAYERLGRKGATNGKAGRRVSISAHAKTREQQRKPATQHSFISNVAETRRSRKGKMPNYDDESPTGR
jgi:hypothetical protein